MSELQKRWDEMDRSTDGNNWYWLAYGEKCYAYAVVTAIAADDEDEGNEPPAGTRLMPSENDERTYIGVNGVRMIVDEQIANIERRNGYAICKFIAEAWADAHRRFKQAETTP